MSQFQSLRVFGCAALLGFLCADAGAQDRPTLDRAVEKPAVQKPAVQKPAVQTPAEKQKPAEKVPSWHELNVKYAKTKLLLAEAELLSALDSNRQSPGVIAKLVVERLKSNVAVAEQQLQEAELATVGGNDRIRVRHAEEKIRLAKLDWENGKVLSGKGMISDLELERLRLKLELAKLSLVMLKNPKYVTTLLQYLEAKVDRMGEEILVLDQRLSKLEPIRGALPKNQ